MSSSWHDEQAKSLLTVSVHRGPAFQNNNDKLGSNSTEEATD